MTTINYTTEYNLSAGFVRVEWAGLSDSDEGQVFNCNGLRLVTIQYAGSFGDNGVVSLQGSNESSPANFRVLDSASASDLRNVELATLVGAIKPVADDNINADNVTVSLLFIAA